MDRLAMTHQKIIKKALFIFFFLRLPAIKTAPPRDYCFGFSLKNILSDGALLMTKDSCRYDVQLVRLVL